MMLSARIFVLFVLLACCSALKKARPWRSEKKFQIEILSKNDTSIQARFRQLRKVRRYFVSVSVKNLADVSSHYTTKLKGKKDRKADGYYYVETGNSLQAGVTYDLSVFRLRGHRFIKSVDVFTDCDIYSYYCTTKYGPICLSSEHLCDGRNHCVDASDEREVNETCSVTLPERPMPTPPPPPTNTPCMRNLTATLERARRDGTDPSTIDVPSCGPDGHYEPMSCDDELTCHCVHPLTAKILKTQIDFHPFVHWDFGDICRQKSKRILAGKPTIETDNEEADRDISTPPNTFPDGFPEIPPLPDLPAPFDHGSFVHPPSFPEPPYP